MEFLQFLKYEVELIYIKVYLIQLKIFFFLKIFGMKIYFYRFEIIYREVLNIFDLQVKI